MPSSFTHGGTHASSPPNPCHTRPSVPLRRRHSASHAWPSHPSARSPPEVLVTVLFAASVRISPSPRPAAASGTQSPCFRLDLHATPVLPTSSASHRALAQGQRLLRRPPPPVSFCCPLRGHLRSPRLPDPLLHYGHSLLCSSSRDTTAPPAKVDQLVLPPTPTAYLVLRASLSPALTPRCSASASSACHSQLLLLIAGGR